MLAALLDIEELELDEDDAKKLADAVAEVQRQYAVAVDPKKMALINLAGVCGKIYGTSFIAWRARRKKERAKARLEVVPQAQPAPRAEPAAAPPRRPANGAPETPADLWPQSGVVTGGAFPTP